MAEAGATTGKKKNKFTHDRFKVVGVKAGVGLSKG